MFYAPLFSAHDGADRRPSRPTPHPADALRGQPPPPSFLCARPEIGWRGDERVAGSRLAADLPADERQKVVLSIPTSGGKLDLSPGGLPPFASPTMEPARPAGKIAAWISDGRQRLNELSDKVAPAEADAEVRRRVFLFVAFSMQGVVFGMLFALFYLAIGHPWGALTVLGCTAAMALAPSVIRSKGLEGAGNLYALVLVTGFTALTAMEGGLYGHAVAWLAVVPLCACLLVGQQMAKLWCGVCLSIMGVFCLLSLHGNVVPRMYPARWEPIITSAGYLTLTIFMATIGVTFEKSRRRSLQKINDTLEALSQANDQLHDLDKERRAFLGIAAHDLRSPLSTIIGFASLVQQLSPPTDPLQRDSIERILSASGRMQHLLDRLLSVQAIEEGKLHIQLQPCDLVALARQTVDQYRAAAAAKSIQLEFLPAADLPQVQSDAAATTQILDNLISNAIKFSPANRPVIVRVVPGDGGPDDDLIRVEVQDAGPGLSEEDQRKLYGRFAKLSALPTGGESSSGLGLSIVRRLADSISGQLTCRSKLGEGATFSLSLKRAGTSVAATFEPALN